jgi:hypothetical protein
VQECSIGLIRFPKVRYEGFIAVAMKNTVFCDVTPRGSCKNRRLEGTYRPRHKMTRIGERGTTLAVSSDRSHLSVLRLLVTANVVPSSPTRVILMMEAMCSTETLVLTRATRRPIPEDGILVVFC